MRRGRYELWCMYTVQGEEDETLNAFPVQLSSENPETCLGMLAASFANRRTGAPWERWHWRVKVADPGFGYAWEDLTDGEKVLRAEEISSDVYAIFCRIVDQSPRAVAARAVAARAARMPRIKGTRVIENIKKQEPYRDETSSENNKPQVVQQQQQRRRQQQQQQQQQAAAPPQQQQQQQRSPQQPQQQAPPPPPKEELNIFGDDDDVPSQKPPLSAHPSASAFSTESNDNLLNDDSGLRQAPLGSQFSSEPSLLGEIDDDDDPPLTPLSSPSLMSPEEVQRAVSDRRANLAQSISENQQNAKDEIRKRQADAAEAAAEKDRLRQVLGPKLKAWSEDHGKKKNIRALLGGMDKVMWPEANWKPISIGDLLQPGQVRKGYYKASRSVHPDKLVGLTIEQQFVGQTIFDALSQAFHEFQDNKGI